MVDMLFLGVCRQLVVEYSFCPLFLSGEVVSPSVGFVCCSVGFLLEDLASGVVGFSVGLWCAGGSRGCV